MRDFGAAVERDPALFALVHGMFDKTHAAAHLSQLLKMIDAVLTTPRVLQPYRSGGLPINAMLTSIMATDKGYTFFLDATVNRH